MNKTDAFLILAMEYEGDECLLWPYARNDQGYPQFRRGKDIFYAHRVICEKVNGPSWKEATHSCNRGKDGCVNKRHLSWKTHTENMADKKVHGTQVRGSDQNGAKLTEDQVMAIRASTLSNRLTGIQFGVSPAQVSRIKNNQRWSWLT